MHVQYDDKNAATHIAKAVRKALLTAEGRPIVLLCIGTDRSTGDAFGPLIGTALSKRPINNTYVYGTLLEPVHAVNLPLILDSIYMRFDNPFVIAIDSCLGQANTIGKIAFEKGSINPGAGVKKELPAAGDYFLTGNVNVAGFMEYFVLQNTRLSQVMRMAEVATKAIRKGASGWRRAQKVQKEAAATREEK